MKDRVNCKILIIGNEVLDGQVHETNAFWLIKRLSEIGGIVRKVIYIEDNINTIAENIIYEINSDCRLIITSGGLGPTDDDITLEGIAKGLNMPLKMNEEAYSMIRYRYKKLYEEGNTTKLDMNKEREKMSYLPYSSLPLYNDIGTAPGVLIKSNKSIIVSLPGVPEELKYIFDNTLIPFLNNILPKNIVKIQKNIILNITDESLIADKLTKTKKKYKYLYIKSKPGKEETKNRIKITITGIGKKSFIEKEIKEVTQILENIS